MTLCAYILSSIAKVSVLWRDPAARCLALGTVSQLVVKTRPTVTGKGQLFGPTFEKWTFAL